MQYTLTGADEFSDFADQVDDINVERAIRKGLDKTGEDYISAVTSIIDRTRTAKGGTLDSRTSPYSSGSPGSNESGDGYHISDENAWKATRQGPERITVQPIEEVEDRATWLEFGTSDHTSDSPMYFNVNGMTIVVSNVSPDAGLDDRFEGEPAEVSGVNAQNFFSQAAQQLRNNERVKRNLREALEDEVQRAMSGGE